MISIVIPTYNRSKFLPRVLDSVLKQSYGHWELIISDDGSTDNTETVIKQFLSDSRIKYIKNRNAGATAARNAGAKVSTGKFVTFLDSDDEAKSNWLEIFQKEIDKGEEVICCGYEYVDHNGIKIGENMPRKLGNIYSDRVGRFTNGGVFILNRATFLEIGGYDELVQAGQHSEMAIRLVKLLDKRNIEIKNIFKPLIRVHVHKGQKIRSDHKAVFKGSIYVLQKHQDLFKKNPKLYANYLNVAGVNGMKINEVKKSKELFLKAWLLDPMNTKNLGRYFISQIPLLRKHIWKLNK